MAKKLGILLKQMFFDSFNTYKTNTFRSPSSTFDCEIFMFDRMIRLWDGEA